MSIAMRVKAAVIGGLIFLILSVGLAYKSCDSDDSLKGTDANNDGVRDDVERLIEEKWGSNPKVKSAAMQLAKTFQNDITNPASTDYKTGMFAVICLRYIAHDDTTDILQTIQSAMANTSARSRALIKFDAKFNGKILSSANSREEACAFDPNLVR